MIVNVMGIGRALRIDLEDVLVRAEVKYQIRQRPYINLSAVSKKVIANE